MMQVALDKQLLLQELCNIVSGDTFPIFITVGYDG